MNNEIKHMSAALLHKTAMKFPTRGPKVVALELFWGTGKDCSAAQLQKTTKRRNKCWLPIRAVVHVLQQRLKH